MDTNARAEKRKDVITYGATGLLLAIALFLAVRSYLKNKEANDLLDNAANDLNAQYAIQIRTLTDKGLTEWAFGISGEARGKLLFISGQIRDFANVQRAYRTLYNRDVLGDLRASLSQTEYVQFMQNVYNGNPTNPAPTRPPQTGIREVVATRATNIYAYPFAGWDKVKFTAQNLDFIGTTNGQIVNVRLNSGGVIGMYVVSYKDWFGWVQNTGLVAVSGVRLQ